jgi:mycothiol synthase
MPADRDDDFPPMPPAPQQLRMRRPDLEDLPPLQVASGYALRTYLPGDEHAWAAIMNTGIGHGWTAETARQRLFGQPQFDPMSTFFAVALDGSPVGSACVWTERPAERCMAVVHMVCVLPEHRGNHLGQSVTLATLYRMRERGFLQAKLSTDDWRIPAIKEYVRLGFLPVLHVEQEDHNGRWAAVLEHITTNAVRPQAPEQGDRR